MRSVPYASYDSLPSVAVFLPSLAGGGAERVTLTLCEGLARVGWSVDLVVGTSDGPLAEQVPDGVTLHDLGVRRTLSAAPGLLRYLRGSRHDVLIAAITHANIVASLVARFVRPRCRVIVMHHNTTSISTRNTGKRLDRMLPILSGVAYRLADRIVAVSQGVAADLASSSHLSANRVQVMCNPIDYAAIRKEAPIDTALLPRGDDPLVVAAGRFESQKGFDVLLRAKAASTQPWRLIVLGDGPLRPGMIALARELGVDQQVSMPGFIANPYPYFRAATTFALSSRYEGLPTVLLECLAFDLRIVSTNCPSGPDEILAGVDGTELVAVDDHAQLAAALDRAVSAGALSTPRQQWRRYDIDEVMFQLTTLILRLTNREPTPSGYAKRTA